MKYLIDVLNGRPFVFKSRINYWLALSVIFSFGLVISVSVVTDTYPLLFLVWNLFLAFIPLAITNWLQRRKDQIQSKIIFSTIVLVWLLYIPNSFYILTDLFHLGKFPGIPLWLELAILFSFAWNGLLMGILSVRQMELLFTAVFFRPARLLFIFPVMFLIALGVYIGRYLRYNSWDVVTNPFHLGIDIFELALHPLKYSQAWAMVMCFSIFLTLIFFTLINANRDDVNTKTTWSYWDSF